MNRRRPRELVGAGERASWDHHDVWMTPGDVAEQGLVSAAQLGVLPDEVVDLGAGAGSIISRAANVWPGARRGAIEIRPEERPHLERWADWVTIEDFRRVILTRDDLVDVDPEDRVVVDGAPLPTRRFTRRLLVANPPYKDVTVALEWGFRMRFDWILFLLRKSYGESEDASIFFSTLSPIAELHLPARANFRAGESANGGKYSADFLGHRWVLWRPGVHPPLWATAHLPPLPSTSLTWVIRPGTEEERGALHPLYRTRFPALEAAQHG